jgi:uncharacterized membrane protein
VIRRTFVLSLVLCALMGAVSLFAWDRIQPGTPLPIHWGVDGAADGFAPKEVALLLLPGVALALSLLFVVVPFLEPRRTNLVRSFGTYRVIWLGVVALMAMLHAAMVSVALGAELSIDRVVAGGVGLLFALIGDRLPKQRSTFTVGIRTPWTLSSERSWAVTHRLGGWAFVVFGLLTALLAVAGAPGAILATVLLGGLVGSLVALTIVSYRVWATDPDRAPQGREEGRP